MKPFELKTTLKEAQIFASVLRAEIYKSWKPLRIEIAVSDEPVPFSERLGLRYKKYAEGDRWASKPFECGWMHLTGETPPAQKGRERVLLVDVSGEGCLFDKSGTPVRGLTNAASVFDRRYGCPAKTVLFLNEIEGSEEGIDVWIELGSNDLFGNGRTGEILQCCSAYCNGELRAYYYDFAFLLDYLAAADDKNPQYYAILRALRDSMAKVSPEFADGEIAAARAALAGQLAKKNGDTFLTFYALGHAHLDLAWLWPIRETKRKAGRTFANVLANMERYPSFRFGASQPQQFAWAEEAYPALFEKIRRRVDEGRFELQGGMWVEADSNLSGGEALVRQFLYGKKYFREKFGKEMNICWLPDAFGFSGALPQIMRKCGIDYFLTIKLSWSEHFEFPHHTFRWQGIDGSEVLAHMPPEGNYNSSADAATLLAAQGNFTERGLSDKAMLLFGIGDGGGGPGRDHIERVQRSYDFAGLPPVRQKFASEFFGEIEPLRNEFAVWKGELYLDRHQGTLTSAAKNKRYNRLSERMLSAAEKASVIAGTYASFGRPDLEETWKEVLLYQFHDILPGSSIRRVYEECEPRYKAILGQLNDVLNGAAASLGGELCVFNPNSFAIDTVVQAEGKFYKVHALPLAFTPLREEYTGQGAVLGEDYLENMYLRAEFSADGQVRVLDKASGEWSVCGNIFRIYNEFLDCWDMSAEFKKFCAGNMRLVSRRGRKEGDCAVMEQEFRFGKSTLRQRVVLAEEAKILDFRCRADWQETRRMLRVEFEPQEKADCAVCGIQFGSVERPTYSSTVEQFGKYEVSMQYYVDVSGSDRGVAVLNDCKYGVNVKDGQIGINLLRSQMYPCVDCDKGEHEFSYAVYPHAGNRYSSDVVRAAEEYNNPLLVCRGAETQPLFELSGGGVIIETVKFAEDGDGVVVRLYETDRRHARVRLTAGFSFASVCETDMLENEIRALPSEGGTVDLAFGPFEIKTVRFYSKGERK